MRSHSVSQDCHTTPRGKWWGVGFVRRVWPDTVISYHSWWFLQKNFHWRSINHRCLSRPCQMFCIILYNPWLYLRLFFPHSNLCKWFLFIKQIKAITTLQLDTAKVEKDHGDSKEGTSWLPCKIKFWLEFIIKMKSHTLGICDSWWNLDFSWKFCKQIFLHNFDSTIIFLNHSPEGKKPP